jgi:hypothetical protein
MVHLADNFQDDDRCPEVYDHGKQLGNENAGNIKYVSKTKPARI